MTKTRNTKRALLSSALALIICIAMLVGSTYAWFTDSVTSANNKIVAGNLDVQLLMDTGSGYTDISNSDKPIFGAGSIAQNNNAETLWEPGKTQVAYLAIKNNGSLALKYKVALEVTNVSKDLYKVMKYDIIENATLSAPVTGWTSGDSVVVGKQSVSDEVSLGVDGTHYFALAIHMDESAGNEYQGGEVDFDLTVLATQDTVEADSFGTDYDEFAAFPYTASGKIKDGQSALELEIRDVNEAKVGSAVIPAEAIADGAEVNVNIDESAYEGNFTVAAGLETTVFDVTVEGLKEGNTTPVKVSLRIPAGLDPATVKLYHYDTPVTNAVYNPTTGYVTFESATFSPFTVVYDAESKYVAPEVPEGKPYPTAKVTYEDQYVGEGKITWSSYGQWSPTAGLDSDLEAAFTFKCPDDLSEDVRAAFEYWYCDFYVSLDRDLGANQIFLGGNYGSFGWVGFHNGELTLAANEEIPLLGSVTSNPWTYDDVESMVGTFICGVGDVDNALEGATFTVNLRLTNPKNENEYYNVNVVKHTFGGNSSIDGTTVVTTAQGLQDAVNNIEGSGEIVLGGDIDLGNGGIVIP